MTYVQKGYLPVHGQHAVSPQTLRNQVVVLMPDGWDNFCRCYNVVPAELRQKIIYIPYRGADNHQKINLTKVNGRESLTLYIESYF